MRDFMDTALNYHPDRCERPTYDALTQLVAALRAVEWDIAGTCASCGVEYNADHADDCQLAAALKAAEEVMPVKNTD